MESNKARVTKSFALPSQLKIFCLVILGSLIGGCSLVPVETFTLKTDLPADFRLEAKAKYEPAPEESCTLGPRPKNGKRFKSERQEIPHTVEFEIPLTNRVDGCPLVLTSVQLEVKGHYGPSWGDIGADNAWLSFIDGGSLLAANASEPHSKIYNAQCQWFFRTMGPRRYLAKVLKCRAEDENGQVLKRMAGGYLQRDQWSGRTVSMSFKVVEEESPYFKGYWLKTAGGWKPCGGRWGRDMEELCLNPPQFKTFKMPDGRDCSVYPSCDEQGL